MKAYLDQVAPPSTEIEQLSRVIVAPELIGVAHQVIRAEDNSDADYAARSELFTLISEAARKP